MYAPILLVSHQTKEFICLLRIARFFGLPGL